MKVQFWSLGRSGLFAITGKPRIRTFCAALHSCGLPRIYARRSSSLNDRWLELDIEFRSRDKRLFRCHFTVQILHRKNRRYVRSI